MEHDTNRNYYHPDTSPQHTSKEYPGYTSDRNWETIPETNPIRYKIEDARLAESGPVRNPNYHDLTQIYQESEEEQSTLKKETLKDYNETDPKRDINQDGSANPDSDK